MVFTDVIKPMHMLHQIEQKKITLKLKCIHAMGGGNFSPSFLFHSHVISLKMSFQVLKIVEDDVCCNL